MVLKFHTLLGSCANNCANKTHSGYRQRILFYQKHLHWSFLIHIAKSHSEVLTKVRLAKDLLLFLGLPINMEKSSVHPYYSIRHQKIVLICITMFSRRLVARIESEEPIPCSFAFSKQEKLLFNKQRLYPKFFFFSLTICISDCWLDDMTKVTHGLPSLLARAPAS